MVSATQVSDQQQAYEEALAKAYLDVPQHFHPGLIDIHNAQLWTGAFGEKYRVGVSGLWSIGNTGPLDISTYTIVNSAQGGVAPILELSLWKIDPAQYGIILPTPIGTTVECFFHAARFGPTEPHVGYTFRFDDGVTSILIFVPLTNVPDVGMITADDAARFLAFVATDGFESMTFLECAMGENLPMPGRGNSTGSFRTARTETNDTEDQALTLWCDHEALYECIDEAAATYSQDLTNAHNNYTNRLNEIFKEFGNDAKRSLGGLMAAGAVGGAMYGAPGGVAGAGVGALTGIFVAGVGWLIDTAFGADYAQDAIDAAAAKYEQAKCDAMHKAADALKNCFAEHCPEAYESACEQIDQAVAESGC